MVVERDLDRIVASGQVLLIPHCVRAFTTKKTLPRHVWQSKVFLNKYSDNC
jgi:hypothetical protein